MTFLPFFIPNIYNIHLIGDVTQNGLIFNR